MWSESDDVSSDGHSHFGASSSQHGEAPVEKRNALYEWLWGTGKHADREVRIMVGDDLKETLHLHFVILASHSVVLRAQNESFPSADGVITVNFAHDNDHAAFRLL